MRPRDVAPPLEVRVDALERRERTRALAERRARLQKDGHVAYVHNPLHVAAVKRDPCEKCGRRTMQYLGGVSEPHPPHGQVEFIRCRACGWWMEI